MGNKCEAEFRGGPDVIIEAALLTIADDQWSLLRDALLEKGFIDEEASCCSFEEATGLVEELDDDDKKELASLIEKKELVLGA